MNLRYLPRLRSAQPSSAPRSTVPPVVLLNPGTLASRYQVTPRLALVVTTDEQRSLTIIQLLIEAAAP